MRLCVCVCEGDGVQKMLALSKNKRDDQGSHKTDVSSSMNTVGRSHFRRPPGQRSCKEKRRRHDFIRKIKKANKKLT